VAEAELAAYYGVIVELGSDAGSSLNLAWRFMGEWM
jgi:hypothetical protein